MNSAVHHIVFRTDANHQIGTGHFMRCLTFADGLKKSNSHIRFISRYLPEYLQEMLVEKGYECILINTKRNNMPLDELAHSNWLGVNQKQDAEDTVQALSDLKWDWLIVDHYALDAEWETEIKQVAAHVFVIDDIADRHHECDVLLDQNYYKNMDIRYTGKVPENCQLLLGPKYALLRDEFKRLHKKTSPRNGSVKKLLIFFGGVDADNYTSRIVKLLSDLNVSDMQVDVVIGSKHPYGTEIIEACKNRNFFCHVQTTNMAGLMASADLSIGGAGSTTWERCCLGLPALTFSLADNQTEIALGLETLGAGKYVNLFKYDSDKKLYKVIFDFLNNRDEISKLSRNAYSIVDGMGVERVCDVVLPVL